jgi:tight adherence protein C
MVLVGGDSRRRLASRLAPHVRDVVRGVSASPAINGPARVLAVLVRFPRNARRRRVRRRALTEELPELLDILGLCVSAGMSIPTALERVGSRGNGVLADECRLVATEVSMGVSVADALHFSDKRIGHEGWTRLIEHLTTARRHGTPLAEIVRSLADDEASAAGRRLLESASARETLMMFPLVFGILPATVLIAVYPGVTAIGLLI